MPSVMNRGRDNLVNAGGPLSERPLHATQSVGNLVQFHSVRPEPYLELPRESRLTTPWSTNNVHTARWPDACP
jgi:hypothetical protein